MPWLEIHHIVVIKDEAANDGVYTIDFSPLNQTKLGTLARMFFGQSVPGEIRVRHIPEEDANLNEIKDNCMCADLTLQSLGDMMNPISSSMGVISQLRQNRGNTEQSVIRSLSSSSRDDQYRILNKMIKNRRVADAIYAVRGSWCTNMNLYFHNCQHFSFNAMKKIAEIDGIRVVSVS